MKSWCGGCSFEVPDGFIVQHAVAAGDADIPEGITPPVCVTLVSATPLEPKGPIFSEGPDDLDPGCYPESLSLFAAHTGGRTLPMQHIDTAIAAYEGTLEHVVVHRRETTDVGGERGALLYVTHGGPMAIAQITLAWPVDDRLFTATLMTSPDRAEQRIGTLRRFVASVEMSGPPAHKRQD